jgi:hypothetical protein
LSTAAASSNANIAAAAGTLTSASDNGKNFDTEVLGALSTHEDRLTTLEDVVAAGDADNLAALEAGDAATLEAANIYTDESVAAEAEARIAGDAETLASANEYTDDAVAAEAALRIAGDAATLTTANSFTTSAVAAETTARTAAVTTLTTRIGAEETARAAADTALTTRIAAEETARAAADTALGARITAENSARVAADNALGARITDLDNTLRDKIASSTATAIAMGGSTILPDTNFTLSGNVGMYEGASAVALNAAGRVSEKVYVTAAVGGGLNKGGKLGGRVGVVFGF